MMSVFAIIVSILILVTDTIVQCRTVGSNTTSSRQLRTFFPKSDTNNEMRGFAVFENGIVLEDMTTTCTFDAFFPLSGDVILNGGALHLKRDLIFKNPLYFGVGAIYGNGHTVEFPGNISNLALPTEGHTRLLTFMEEIDIQDDVNSVDWSYDDQYLAMVSNTVSGINELQVFYFDGLVLTLTASYDFGSRDAYSVRWHPSDYYLVTGQNGDDELRTFHLDVPAGTFTEKDSANIGRCYAVAWNPLGSHIAVGKYNDNEIAIYDIAAGMLGTVHTGTYESNRTVQRNALDWDQTGSYLAVGLSSNGSHEDLKIFHFDGTNVNLNVDAEIGGHVYAVSWSPTGDYLAVGKSNGSKRLVLYKHDAQAGTLTKVDEAGENRPVYALDWSADGKYVAMGRSRGSDHMEIRIFSIDTSDDSLHLLTGYELNQHVRDVRWSHNGNYLAAGDIGNKLSLFSFSDYPFYGNDIKFFFNSDITIHGVMRFQGDCVLNGGGHIVDLAGTATFVVDENSSLVLENMILKGISGNNVCCTDDTGEITLRDLVWIQDSNTTFSVGALQFKNDVHMIGDDTTFAYQTSQTSTLLAKSNLYLDAGFTFSYDPIVTAATDLLNFKDATSVLVLDGATLHTTVTGLELTKGKMLVKRDSFLSAERQIVEDDYLDVDETVEGGITFGSNTSSDDFTCEILSSVVLHLSQGTMLYKNVNASSWSMISDSSVLKLKDNTALRLYQNLNLNEGVASFANGTLLARSSGKKIIGSVYTLGELSFLDI